MLSKKNLAKIKLMEVCGTHTMAIARSGIKKLLPKEIELISGPGCPVCVTSQQDIDKAIKIAQEENVIIATFGDMMRVPGTQGSLQEAKANGADVRVVYSPLDSLKIAKSNPNKKVVFIGVGFETTFPTIAATILEAKKREIKNFYVLSYFKVIFPALEVIASSKKIKVNGFICPGHVSVITGTEPYEKIARKYKIACVITGFDEPDLARGIDLLVKQVINKDPKVEIEYKKVVRKQGNPMARKIAREVFRITDSTWRGIGVIPKTGLKLKRKYQDFDAERIFKVKVPRLYINKECICGEVLQGIKSPKNCKLFRKACKPEKPIGPCMVSSEGTCAAYYKYE